MHVSERSQEYHDAHLAFSRSEIVTAAAKREAILNRLLAYTDDVVKAERDRLRGAVERDTQALLAASELRVEQLEAAVSAVEAAQLRGEVPAYVVRLMREAMNEHSS